MRGILTAAVAALAVAGCAKSPDAIAPSYVSEVGYRSWRCQDLAEETGRLSAALARTSGQQEKARSNDIVGVLLIGLPVSTLSGDNVAPEVARLKGESEAVRRAMIEKRCTPTIASATTREAEK